jgi:CTP:molybdopterin cytidylyltransferase MocA
VARGQSPPKIVARGRSPLKIVARGRSPLTRRVQLAAFAQSVGCVILAAGASTRFRNGDKLLANFGDKPLVQHAIDAACASRAVYCAIVVGADREAIKTETDMRRCAVIENEGWREGIASSIRCALRNRCDDNATIFVVGDEPFVTAGDIDALIGEHDNHPNAIVALRAGEVWGTPVLFPRTDYPALLKLRGDRGAKTFAKGQTNRVRFVSAANSRAFTDIDTEADLKRANTDNPKGRKGVTGVA